ncbi:MAG: divalent-cation tolerance protein CutA [Candidatus Undinarchaeales archaeon]
MKYKIIYTTAPDKEAKEISKNLLEEKLIACSNIFSISSIYKWEGEIKEEKEAGMVLKTKEELTDKVIKRIKELHSYDVPEILIINIEKGNDKYLKWIKEVTND